MAYGNGARVRDAPGFSPCATRFLARSLRAAKDTFRSAGP